MGDAGKLLEFCKLIGQLKHLKRTGWVKRGVADPETVTGHMYRMAVLAFCLDSPSLDRDKCIRMALVHDMAECIVGDITPHCGISPELKQQLERDGFRKLTALVEPKVGAEFTSLWEEYEAQETSEAKAVKDLDKFDMLAQAEEYETEQMGHGRLQEFFDNTPPSTFVHPKVVDWFKELERRRSNKD